MTLGMKIGQVLISRGVLTEEKVQAIVARQRAERRPFGALAAEMYGLSEQVLWEAWGQQILPFLAEVDLAATPSTREALTSISSRDAWAYRLLPLKVQDGHLLMACCTERVPKAVAWSYMNLEGCPDLVLAEPMVLEQQVLARYASISHTAQPREAVRVRNAS